MTDTEDTALDRAKRDRAVALDRRDRAKIEYLVADRDWKVKSRRVDRLLADRGAAEKQPPLPFPAPNGLVEIADLHARLRDPELTAAFMAEKEAERADLEPEQTGPGQDWGMWTATPDDVGPAGPAAPIVAAAIAGEAEKQKRRDRDARRRERERADARTKAAAPADGFTSAGTTTFDTSGGDEALREHLEEIEVLANSAAASGVVEPAKGPQATDPTNVAAGRIDSIDVELRHALLTRQTMPSGAEKAIGAWGYRAKVGATNADIFAELKDAWGDHVMVTVEDSPVRRAYAVRGWPMPSIWLGGFRGSTHKPDLHGMALVERVRAILEIPTPSAVAKAAKGATVREPVPPPTAADREPVRKRASATKKGRRIPGALTPE